MIMLNWFQKFVREDTLRKVIQAEVENIVHRFLEELSGMGCWVRKHHDGSRPMIVIDGHTDVPFPPDILPAWKHHPFVATLGGTSGNEVTVHSGWFWAGAPYGNHGWHHRWTEAEAAADVQTISLATDEEYIIFFELACDTATGTVPYYELSSLDVASYETYANKDNAAMQPVYYVRVAGGKIVETRQELFCDFGVPIRYEAELELSGYTIQQRAGTGAYYVSWFTGKTYTNT